MPRKKNDDDSDVQAQPAPGNVFIRVTKFGAGKVSTGEHIAEQGDVMAQEDYILEVSEEVAKSMEAKGYGEIE